MSQPFSQARCTCPVSTRRIACALLLSAISGACAKKDQGIDSTAAAVAAASTPTSEMSPQAKPDDQMQAVLDQLASMGGKPIELLAPAEARLQPTPAAAAALVAASKGKDTTSAVMVPGVTAVDRNIPGAAGNIPARVYTPDGAGPFPVIVYYHGGGWVIASKEVYDAGAARSRKRRWGGCRLC